MTGKLVKAALGLFALGGGVALGGMLVGMGLVEIITRIFGG